MKGQRAGHVSLERMAGAGAAIVRLRPAAPAEAELAQEDILEDAELPALSYDEVLDARQAAGILASDWSVEAKWPAELAQRWPPRLHRCDLSASALAALQSDLLAQTAAQPTQSGRQPGTPCRRKRARKAVEASRMERDSDAVSESHVRCSAQAGSSSSGDTASGLTETGASARSELEQQARKKRRKVQDGEEVASGDAKKGRIGRVEGSGEGDEVVAGDLRARVATVLREADLDKLSLREVITQLREEFKGTVTAKAIRDEVDRFLQEVPGTGGGEPFSEDSEDTLWKVSIEEELKTPFSALHPSAANHGDGRPALFLRSRTRTDLTDDSADLDAAALALHSALVSLAAAHQRASGRPGPANAAGGGAGPSPGRGRNVAVPADDMSPRHLLSQQPSGLPQSSQAAAGVDDGEPDQTMTDAEHSSGQPLRQPPSGLPWGIPAGDAAADMDGFEQDQAMVDAQHAPLEESPAPAGGDVGRASEGVPAEGEAAAAGFERADAPGYEAEADEGDAGTVNEHSSPGQAADSLEREAAASGDANWAAPSTSGELDGEISNGNRAAAAVSKRTFQLVYALLDRLLAARWEADVRPARRGVAFRLPFHLPQLPRWSPANLPSCGVQSLGEKAGTEREHPSPAAEAALSQAQPADVSTVESSVPHETEEGLSPSRAAQQGGGEASGRGAAAQEAAAGFTARQDVDRPSANVEEAPLQSLEGGASALGALSVHREVGKGSGEAATEEVDGAAVEAEGARAGQEFDSPGGPHLRAAAGEAGEQVTAHAPGEQVYSGVAGDPQLVFKAAAAVGVPQEVVGLAVQRYQTLVGASGN